MHPAPDATFQQIRASTRNNPNTIIPSENGFSHCHPSRRLQAAVSRIRNSDGDYEGDRDGVKNLSGANDGDRGATPPVAGQRVKDYENASLSATHCQALGFQVVSGTRHSEDVDGAGATRIVLTDLPNELLADILSHLHPDSLPVIALVCKRLYTLVTSPHSWLLAFFRHFPGSTAIRCANSVSSTGLGHDGANPSDMSISEPSYPSRTETRLFARLTAQATWRGEFLLRTRLFRNLVRGTPGSKSKEKSSSGVLTYGTKLPWIVTHLHATLCHGKRGPRVVHAVADLGLATASDPTTGKVEAWGVEDSFSVAQWHEVFPGLEPYGLGDGPTLLPNVVDVSCPYGMVAAEGFPGGRVFFRSSIEMCGIYLGQAEAEPSVDSASPLQSPQIPASMEAISCVWIAKSSAVPIVTESMVGIMTGSTMGVVTCYSLAFERGASWFSNGEMTVKWVLSPGVPIICLKVDENYSHKRRAAGRVWAVCVNALGEVYYLTGKLLTPGDRTKSNSLMRAWAAGRSVCWQLVKSTQRRVRVSSVIHVSTPGAGNAAAFQRTSIERDPEELVTESRKVEAIMRQPPSYFRTLFDGWNMQRRLEVDFGGDDGEGGGEAIFMIDCGLEAEVCRLSRLGPPGRAVDEEEGRLAVVFAGDADCGAASSSNWIMTMFRLEATTAKEPRARITASAMDSSLYASFTLAEDRVDSAESVGANNVMGTVGTTRVATELPGRRARMLAVGFNNGVVLVWDARAPVPAVKGNGVEPVRVMQTESPEISCLAVSSLYVVHGGSDGLAQAWDPLGSISGPVRTLNARSTSGRVSRQVLATNLTNRPANLSAVGAIYLDPNARALRGLVAFGPVVRSWSFSSTDSYRPRRRGARQERQMDTGASRRVNRTVATYIATEAREVRQHTEQQAREEARLRARFGVGELTEAEAIEYARMISEESFVQDEQRRASSSEDSASSISSYLPSSTSFSPAGMEKDEDDFERQTQRALRLSLLEGVNDCGQSPRSTHSPAQFDFPIRYKSVHGRRSVASTPTTPGRSHVSCLGPGPGPSLASAVVPVPALGGEGSGRGGRSGSGVGLGICAEDFPPLGEEGRRNR